MQMQGTYHPFSGDLINVKFFWFKPVWIIINYQLLIIVYKFPKSTRDALLCVTLVYNTE